MRRSLAAVALLALALTGCAQTSPYNPAEEVFGSWHLVEGSDAAGDFELGATVPTLTIDAGQAGGQTPCNRFAASVFGENGEISVTPNSVTEAACADSSLMDLESRYLAALGEVVASSVGSGGSTAETLTLTGGAVTLVFERSAELEASALIGTRFTLTNLVSTTDEAVTAIAVLGSSWLSLSINGELNGNAGCRDFAGRYSLSGSTVTVTGLQFAAADCPAEFVEQEAHIETVLGSTFSATIEGAGLSITSADGGLGLEYTAAE